MEESYQIKKPVSNLNFLTIAIKYIVLFIVLFLGSWFAIPIFVSNGRPTRINKTYELLFYNPLITSIIISIAVISWFIYRIIKKYKLGEVFQINFNDSDQKLDVKTVNLVNKKVKDNHYDYEDLSFKFKNSEDILFGKQRILIIKNHNETVHKINFERTAWCRNEMIGNLIEKINNWDQKKSYK